MAANVGHQNALYAGLMSSYKNVDATISIDADLQDDINVIENMIDEFNKGNDIVYGVRMIEHQIHSLKDSQHKVSIN